MRTTTSMTALDVVPERLKAFAARRGAELSGLCVVGALAAVVVALASWSVEDPSFNHATSGPVRNLLGAPGAVAADLLMQMFGVAVVAVLAPPAFWALRLLTARRLERPAARIGLWAAGGVLCAGVAAFLPPTARWPLPTGLGGVFGDALAAIPRALFGGFQLGLSIVAIIFAAGAVLALSASVTLRDRFEEDDDEEGGEPVRRADAEEDAGPGFAMVALGAALHGVLTLKGAIARQIAKRRAARAPAERPAPWKTAPQFALRDFDPPFAAFDFSGDEKGRGPAQPFDLRGVEPDEDDQPISEPSFDATAYAPPAARAAARRGKDAPAPSAPSQAEEEPDEDEIFAPEPVRAPPRAPEPARAFVTPAAEPVRPSARARAEAASRGRPPRGAYELPPLAMLAEPKRLPNGQLSEDALSQNARLLEGVLEDFGVKGEIINVRPGPVVTLYELEPAPGIKSSRVIGLADDIARSMSAISARVAVVQGRNAIGVELPNQRRETVFLRELLGSEDFEQSKHRLAIALGKTIGGEPIIVDLARMPHLLVAGTTGSGKSVAINTMILSLLYRLKPEECRLIMVDPKMLELSVYDGIPHLLTPVVTDPKKAVVALKWAVREMEDRYKKMSKLGVRNIDGFNARVAEAAARGETLMRTVQTGYDRETGEAVYEHEPMDLSPLPFIVVIVDEMADLMMVAGKDIEGAIQRLAQMARAAGIHLIMATQRPSVDVITGTIKANFPTRISFQVTSKIDSRTILGEQGAEQLLGQGDMLYMAGGGRISRVHGPFVSDGEVERIVGHLKMQGEPQYLEAITSEDEPGEAEEGGGSPGSMDAEEQGDLYDRAVAIVLRDRKCSTSYIQRRLSVGYNKAASLVERMEQEGVVGAPNHSGKRAILVGGGVDRGAFDLAAEG
ncbi:DNA translocase FtsK [Methylocella sp.]|uniref:DNA translocase FtsK n=1 Tax=Methylocella sp. TaxID=1978226 RepID=UPI0035B05FB8